MKNIVFVLLFLLHVGVVRAEREIDSLSIQKKVMIEDVVVTGTRNETDVRHLPMTISVVKREQIEQRNEASLLPLLTEYIPGLFSTSRGIMGYGVSSGAAGGMSLRGIGGAPQAGIPTTGLLVLIDGHPQYMGLMGHPIADAYQSLLAERVEVLRGPASVLYGSNAMGGVINIVTRKMQQNGIRTHAHVGYGSYNTLQSEVTNRVREGRFTSIFSASYNRTDGHRKDMEFEQYSGYLKLGYEISNSWSMVADVNVTRFNASNPGAISNPLLDNDQRITRGMTSFALTNEYEKTSGSLSFFYNWGKHWINDGYHAGETPLDYRFHSKDLMLGVSWFQSLQLFEGNRVTVGVDYFHFGGEAWNKTLSGERNTQADKTQNDVAGYIDFRQNLYGWLSFDAGLRVDHHSQVGTEWIPQVGFSFHLPRESAIKLMASKGFRYPTIREMYMFRPANPELKSEKMWNYELAFTQRLLEGRLFYGVNLFYIDGENLIMRMPVDGRPLNVNTGKIENTGLEAQVAFQMARAWSMDMNYSYLHMDNPVLASPEHKLYAGTTFSEGRWNVSTGFQYVAGLYKTLDPEEKENFLLWNLRGTYRIREAFDVWVRGENLLARKYEINAGFPMPKATVMVGMNVRF